jgi:hypothetical protein
MCRFRELILFASVIAIVVPSINPAQAATQYAHVKVAAKQPQHTVYVTRTVYVPVEQKKRTLHEYMLAHPKIRSATIGAGVGTAAGVVTGLITGRGIMRSALIGAGTGAGVGLIRSSETLKRHPIARDTATGSAVGLGLGWAASNRWHRLTGPGAGLGAVAGLGVGVLRNGGL